MCVRERETERVVCVRERVVRMLCACVSVAYVRERVVRMLCACVRESCVCALCAFV